MDSYGLLTLKQQSRSATVNVYETVAANAIAERPAMPARSKKQKGAAIPVEDRSGFAGTHSPKSTFFVRCQPASNGAGPTFL